MYVAFDSEVRFLPSGADGLTFLLWFAPLKILRDYALRSRQFYVFVILSSKKINFHAIARFTVIALN